MKFIDPKTDFAFKRIFGSEDSKDALISFINAALKLTGKRKVESVEVKNPYLEKDLPVNKGSIVDIYCTDKTNTRYLVEMQVENIKGFANRLVYNLSKCYSNQLVTGDDYPQLNDVVLIAVMDFTLFKDFKNYHSLFKLKEHELDCSLEQLRLCCLELGKFKKQEHELSGMLDKWIYFIKETDRLEVRPKILKEKVFDEAFEKAQVMNLTPEEKDAYDAAVQEARDKRGMIAHGKETGEARGLIKGRKEGKVETASELLKLGVETDIICKATGLSKTEVDGLKKNLG